MLLWTLDISWYNITRYFIQHNKFGGKTSVRLGFHERHFFLVGAFRELLEKIDRNISGTHCFDYISVHIGLCNSKSFGMIKIYPVTINVICRKQWVHRMQLIIVL